MATKKILSKLFISMIALFILFPSISFAKDGTMIVSATPLKPTTLQISKVTTKKVASDETSTITYNAISDMEPIIEVKKEIIKGQFIEIVTVTF